MRKYKIIFLDIDGVLATLKMRFNSFDPDCVNELNRILTEVPNTKIVVSSTWRIGCGSLSEMKEVLSRGSLFNRSKFHNLEDQKNTLIAKSTIGTTPRLSGRVRGEEIKKWIEDMKGLIEVESFVIVDDDSDMGPFMSKLVKTDPYTGMSREHADQMIEMLNSTEEED